MERPSRMQGMVRARSAPFRRERQRTAEIRKRTGAERDMRLGLGRWPGYFR